MATEKTHFEKTSADTKEIGFDYQYLCFIFKLLDLTINQKITYEEKDDIHIDTNDGNLILIQVKHSIQSKQNDEVVNLTQFDIDLWKTLYNWTKIISDKNDDRKEIKNQLTFVNNTKFVLLTNKDITTNPVLLKIKELKNKQIKQKDFSAYLMELKKKTSNTKIINYIEEISSLNKKVFENFIGNILTEQTKGNIIEIIKQKIRSKMIRDNRVDDVFYAIYAKLKTDFFEKVHEGKKQSISYKEYLDIFTPIFENYKTTLLPCRHFSPILPENIEDQYFIKELIEIGDINITDISEIADYTDSMLQIKMNIDKWYDENELTVEDINNFHAETFNIWKNNHKKHHFNSNNKDNVNAYNCLAEIREKMLKIKQTELQIDASNGEFYYLSNEKEIGWKKRWQEKYKK